MSLVLILNIIFTAAVLWIYAKTGSEPVALIGAWYAFTGGELWLLATIKKKEVEASESERNRNTGTFYSSYEQNFQTGNQENPDVHNDPQHR